MMCSCFLRGFVSEGGGERERELHDVARCVCVMVCVCVCDGVCDGVCVMVCGVCGRERSSFILPLPCHAYLHTINEWMDGWMDGWMDTWTH